MSSDRAIAPIGRLALVLAMVLAPSGCATASPANAPASTPAPQQSPGASPFLSALERTRALGVATVTITVRDAAGTSRARGMVDLTSGYGILDWTGAVGSVHELVNDHGTFRLRPDGGWTAGTTATSHEGDILAGLGRSSVTVTNEPAPSCPAAPCTVYSGTSASGETRTVTVDRDRHVRDILRVSDEGQVHVVVESFGGPLDITTPSTINGTG